MKHLRLTQARVGITDVVEYVRALLLKSGQTTSYYVGDDGDYEIGLSKAYTILTTGQYAGTVNLDVPHYAAATISFAAPDIIADAANGLVTFLNADTVVIKGSASNDGVYTIAAGGATADHFHVAPNVVNEGAARYVSLYKRTAHSNTCVFDLRTGLMWSRTTSNAEKVGITSNGALNWHDVATCFALHPAAADLQIIAASNTLRIVGGAAEVTRYHVGDVLICTGFANPVNNLPGYRVISVTVNGADLDVVVWTGKNTLISEAAAGARTISLVCRSISGYAAAANAAVLSGYTDWRIPNIFSMYSLMDMEAPTGAPDAIAFPGWPTAVYVWSSTTSPANVATGYFAGFAFGGSGTSIKTTATYLTTLVRGG